MVRKRPTFFNTLEPIAIDGHTNTCNVVDNELPSFACWQLVLVYVKALLLYKARPRPNGHAHPVPYRAARVELTHANHAPLGVRARCVGGARQLGCMDGG